VKLRVDDITAEAKELSFAEPREEVNRILEKGPVREVRLDSPIEVTISYYRAGTELFFSGGLHSSALAVCARCAEEFDLDCERDFRFVLAPRSIGLNEAGLREEDLEFSTYEGDYVDLSPLISEQLLLSLPSHLLCHDECRGLCPRCGINLNHAQCDCATEFADSRFAALRGLKVSRS
jgi:uncharacterized protein